VNSQSVYPLLAIFGIVLSSFVWGLLLRNRTEGMDRRLPIIYLTALFGAVVGAKVVYLLAEGWMLPSVETLDRGQLWGAWLTGKSVTGALLGGYLAVEVAKKRTRYTRPTGDLFAVIVPMGLMLGRIGCLVQGCCLGKICEPAWYTLHDQAGVSRWPAVPVEFAFNVILFAAALIAWRRQLFSGQLFHIYLISYGVFRFFHEFLRDTPNIAGPISGYQIAALCILSLGAIRYWQRARGDMKETHHVVPMVERG
jgi:phosphatidylglycerol:prolipoprotein diacylglycerol transferase